MLTQQEEQAVVVVWQVALLAVVMGVLTWAALTLSQLLAGISEQEEQASPHDGAPGSPPPTPTPTPSLTPCHSSRSLQATPEKHRDASRERDVTSAHPRRRRGTRRSLSLPTGSLSYGDVKISYRDGHFVTEPIDGVGGGEGEKEGGCGTGRGRGYERTRSESSGAVLSGSLMNIGSEEEMREEILSLLERGLSTDDITLLFSRYLDHNSNHLAQAAATSQSTQSLTAPGLYHHHHHTQSLPRRRPRHRDVASPRPASVEESSLLERFSQSEQNLVSGDVADREWDMRRTDSFYTAMAAPVVPRECTAEGAQLHRHNSDEAKTERGRSQRLGFLQRMLQKRKSVPDKPVQTNGRTPREDSSSSSSSSSRKGGKESTRKVSIKDIFRRKNSTASLESSKDVEEPGSPPIARFMHDDDIGAVTFLPASPANGRTRSSSHGDGVGCASTDEPDASLPAILRRERLPLPGDLGKGQRRVLECYSGEYCDIDQASEYCRSSESSTLTPRSTSPCTSTASTLTLEGGGSSNRSSLGADFDAFSTMLGSGDLGALERTVDMDSTLRASPGFLDGAQASAGDRTPVNSGHSGSVSRSGRKPCVGKQDIEKLATIVQGEITSSNSNDSGIQRDVAVGSSESLKIPPEVASQLTRGVKLRNSPSPKQERPKSDFTVRWADLLEQVKEADITYRRDGAKLRRRPRPKSDLGGSSLQSADTSSRQLGGALGALGLGTLGGGGGGGSGTLVGAQYDSILSLVELRRPGGRGRLDSAALQAAKLAKARRMSTPQPIKTRADKVIPRSPCKVSVVRSHSMPDNLDRLHRKKNYFSLIGGDMSGELNYQGGADDDDSSDESELSMDYQREKSQSTRASRVTLATLDQMIEEENLTYAEALWDHVTMDPDELGFRAGDLLRVTDTTDKHWWYGATQHRDGWFPAAFVRLRVNQDDLEAEMTLRIQEEEEEQTVQATTSCPSTCNKTQLRANVVNEIITAEAEYVKHLKDVIEGYLKQTRKRPEMFPEEKVRVIFSNIEVIYDFATKLLADLQAAINREHPHLTQFGHCFLDKTQQFEIYSEYCNNHPAACEELREMYRVKRYRHFFEACRLLQEMTEIPLEGFLLTPVQKICKYHLQLAELLKYTPEDHPDFHQVGSAVEAMKHIAKLVNERKRKMESIETLAEWQMMVDDWEGPDILDDSSELIYSGELNKINANGWSQDRFFFLFDHQLVYCKKDLLKKNSFVYKGRVRMDHSIVVSIPDGRDMQYNVTVRNAFKIQDLERDKWYLMVAKTSQIKQRWLKAFSDERRRVHEDMENNFNIPHHLKQAIVSGLKQKSSSKSKGKRNASRSSSMRTSKTSSWTSANATLPRIPKKSSMASSTQQSNRIMNFLLGGKKK